MIMRFAELAGIYRLIWLFLCSQNFKKDGYGI